MTSADIAAYIGAAAWLPQIGTWIYSYFAQPRVDLIASPTPEVGYTTFGPILNLTCAISADTKDAIISDIKATLRHEKGREIKLGWRTLNETFSNIRSTSGEVAEVSRNQPAIALKVSTLALSEKQIGFQDVDYQQKVSSLTAALQEEKNYRDRVSADTATLPKSKQFLDLSDFFKSGFVWQEGTYTVSMAMTVVGVREATVKDLRFTLSKADVERLAKNIEEMQTLLLQVVAPPEKPRNSQWQWANPVLIRVN